MDKEKMEGCGCGCGEHEHHHEESCGCGCGEHQHEDACGCGCGEHDALVVELEDENGNTVPCEVIDGFEFKNNEYALVENPEDHSVYLFKVIGEGEEGQLVVPEDDEFAEATAYYENLLENEE